MRPSCAPRLPPGRGISPASKGEGDGAPSGAQSSSSRGHLRHAWRLSARRPTFLRRRAALCPRTAASCLRLGGTRREGPWPPYLGQAGERPAVSELLAGGRSAPGRSPGAARVQVCETCPRAPTRSPRAGATGSCPSWGRARGNISPKGGGGDKFLGRSRRCDCGPIKDGAEAFHAVFAGQTIRNRSLFEADCHRSTFARRSILRSNFWLCQPAIFI